MAIDKPDLTRVWAQGAPAGNVVDPDITTPGKFDSGWQAEVPPFEHFNFIQKLQTQGLAHINQQGIPVWDSETVYPVEAIAKGSDGKLYKSVSEQSGNDPVITSGFWSDYDVNNRVIQVETISDLSAFSSSAKEQALVSGVPFKYDGTSWVPSEGYVIPECFGAVGDGVSDDTAAIQEASDYAADNKLGVIVPGETYSFVTIRLKNGIKFFDASNTILIPLGLVDPEGTLETDAVIVLEGPNASVEPVDGTKVSAVIDMSNGDRTAILGDGCTNCEFTGCRIYGFTNDVAFDHRGIRLQEGASNNSIHGNYIEGFDAPINRGYLIELWASITGLVFFGGFFDGVRAHQPTPSFRNLIYGNTLINGSYALNCQGGEHNIFSKNICKGQNHRGVWMGNGSWYNIISDNQILDFLSAGILMTYVGTENIISNNKVITSNTEGEGGIVAYTGSEANHIFNNYIDAACNYSVYIATDSSYNVVDGNYSKNAFIAAFAVENDWKDILPTNAFYSRPNYADPDQVDPSATSWTFRDLVGTVFQNNIIERGFGTGSTVGFYIAQIQNSFAGATPTKLRNVTLKNNSILTKDSIGYGLYIYEQIDGDLQEVRLSDNSWVASFVADISHFAGGNPSSFTLNPREVGVIFCEDNGVLDSIIKGPAFNLPDGSTTPIVSNWRFFATSNTSPTTITDFTGAPEGSEIIVRADVNTTIQHNSSLIRLKGAVNAAGLSSNNIIAFRLVGGVWFEIWRNF